MADLSQELAEKVISADLRNLVQKVGAGKTLTVSERQIFMEFCAAQGDADDMVAARVNALLRKWLNGARLSADELSEIQHVLPPEREKSFEGTANDVAGSMGLSRRAFFRWVAAGKEYNDPLPCEDLQTVPAWYERMKSRGMFRNNMPSKVEAAIKGTKKIQKQPAAADAQEQDDEPSTMSRSSSGIMREVLAAGDHGPRGIHVELEALEVRAAQLRKAMLLAYTRGNDDEGDRLSKQHGELVEKLRRIKKDSGKISEDDEELTKKSWVREDLGQIMTSIVTSLEFMANDIYAEIDCATPRQAFTEIYRKHLSKCFHSLRQSKFAPPLKLSA